MMTCSVGFCCCPRFISCYIRTFRMYVTYMLFLYRSIKYKKKKIKNFSTVSGIILKLQTYLGKQKLRYKIKFNVTKDFNIS